MLNEPRLQTLKDRHAALDARILEEDGRPLPNSLELSRLKREKLRLKEEMERFAGRRTQ
ncbi:YdcH family protein [Muricoccus radiodurans]|uniref:YdcH family protein n=1 Tax=Muricoccus radiodurans TaxID=2231721 RepID=UPI003CF70F8C